MLVLDADSVMSGAAILRLVRIMEAHPEIGILQQLIVGLPEPQPVPAHLPVRHAPRHARLHRGQRLVAGRLRPLLGPQCADPRSHRSWRIAGCRCCRAAPPLGGRVLSHDQVEAVLMRRAGLGGPRAARGGRQLRGEPADAARTSSSATCAGARATGSICTWSGAPDLHCDGAAPARARHPDVRLRPGRPPTVSACCPTWRTPGRTPTRSSASCSGVAAAGPDRVQRGSAVRALCRWVARWVGARLSGALQVAVRAGRLFGLHAVAWLGARAARGHPFA